MEPIQRLMSNPLAAAIGTPQLLNDQVTQLSFIDEHSQHPARYV